MMDFERPPYLQKGDQVAVVATARAVDQKPVKKAVEIIRSWQLEVVEGHALYQRAHLFAGTDKNRLADLQKALDNPSIKAIFCARGGYGTTRILDDIDWKGFRAAPKWICGFSDVTALLGIILNQGYCCVHSSMPQLFTNPQAVEDYETLRQFLFGTLNSSLKVRSQPFNQLGEVDGIISGGNLSLLVHGIGTTSEINTEGIILCLEEVDEYMYHLDRMMIQLKRSGKLQGVRAVVVGHITKIKEGDLSFGTTAEGIIASHLPSNIPLAFGFPFGHQSPNLPLPMGFRAKLRVDQHTSELALKYKPGY